MSDTPLFSLLSYVPPAVATTIYHTMRLPTQPIEEPFEAAVLFADVSGFTPLAEALAQQGPRGAEELTRLLNGYFSRMINLIEQRGGSVVKFSGDAMMTVFQANDGQLAVAVAQAIAAAEAMQVAMTEFASLETIAGPVTLGMKIGIGAGTVTGYHVGGEQAKWEYVIAGEPLQQVAEAEHRASRGQIVLSPEAEHLSLVAPTNLAESIPLKSADLAWHAFSAGQQAAAAKALQAYIPDIINSRLSAGQAGWLAELRRQTVLFITIVGGLNYNAPDVINALQTFTHLAQKTILHYEGTINKIAVDDKGTILIALFGAPPFAHENDPERALRCALALQQAAARQQLKLAIGLTTGQVFSGPVGSDTRREYTVMGDTVNLSARLMGVAVKAVINAECVAENGIRCDYETYKMAVESIDFATLPTVQVKGKADPIQLYRPVGPKTKSHAEPNPGLGQFVGRTAEMATLTALLESRYTAPPNRPNQGRIVLVEGEAGLGKSRLIQEIRQRSPLTTGLHFVARASSIERHTPYRIWRDLFGQLFGLADGNTVDETTHHTQVADQVAQLNPDLLERLPLLNDVLPLGFAENELTRGLEAQVRYESLITFLIDLVRAKTRQKPLWLLLEDAHWLDAASWALTLELAHNLADCPLLLMLSLRPLQGDNMRIEYSQLQALDNAETIQLQPLSPGQTAEIVANRLGVAELPQTLITLIENRADGNPFFAEELAHSLENSPVVRFEENDGTRTCQVIAPLDKLTMPDTVQGFVLSRLDRLPAEAYLTLKVAAVAGRSFSYQLIHDVYPTTISAGRLQTYLDELDRRELTLRQQTETAYNLATTTADQPYWFKHIITQEVAYETLLYAQRQQLHGALAGWYEALATLNAPADDEAMLNSALSPYLPLLVHHYRHANDRGRERYYCRLAGQQAANQFANSDALGYFARAIELFELATAEAETDQPELFDLLLAREEIYDRLGNREAQFADLQSMGQFEWLRDDCPRQIQIQNRLARYHELTGDYPAAKAAAEALLALAKKEKDQITQGKSLNHLAAIAWKEGNYDEARQYGLQSMAVFQQMGDKAGEATSLKTLGNICHELGDLVGARQHQMQALALQQSLGDYYGEGASSINIGNSYYSQGDLVQAQTYYGQALTIFQTIGYRRGIAYASGSLAQISRSLGNYDDAFDQFSRTLTILQAIGDRWGEAIGLHNLGLVHLDRGDFTAAQSHCQQALVIQVALGDKRGQAFSLTYLGFALEELDHLAEASHMYNQALHLRREIGQEAMAIENVASLAQVAYKQQHWSLALGYVAEVSEWLAESGTEGIEDPLRVCYAIYWVLNGCGLSTQARSVLTIGYNLLMERAHKIADPAWRKAYLTQVAIHRDIVESWEKP